jgi:hypothetical protein
MREAVPYDPRYAVSEIGIRLANLMECDGKVHFFSRLYDSFEYSEVESWTWNAGEFSQQGDPPRASFWRYYRNGSRHIRLTSEGLRHNIQITDGLGTELPSLHRGSVLTLSVQIMANRARCHTDS